MAKGGYQDVVQKLEVLKSKFVTRVTLELEQFTGQFRSSAERTVRGELAQEGYEWLHRLAGSAGTFGFQALGRQARELELKLKSVSEGGGALPADEFLRQLEGLKELLSADAGSSAIPVLDNQVADALEMTRQGVDLIEPDDSIARELVSGLSRYGYDVTIYPSPDAHQSAGASNRLDTAAVIVNACFLDRFAAVEPEDEPNPVRPLIYLSRKASFETRYRIAEAGAGGLCTVPVDVPALADRIEQLNQERDDSAGGRVVIVDDDEQLAEHYRLVLSAAGMEVVVVTQPAEVVSQLAEFRPDLLLMDIHMGRYSGVSLARLIRFQPEWLGLPIVYLSSEQDRDEQIAALAQGADDFIEKPISDQRLANVVRARCNRARQLARLATRDGLTGLLKHPTIKQELQKEFARCLRHGTDASVAMLDLDHFKSVNDTFGHATGDTVIRALANLLRHRLRKTDAIGRYGGEEFVVILPDCPLNKAQTIMQDVCDQFAGLMFSHQAVDFRVTLSVGVSLLQDFNSAEAALDAADQALYQRKAQGRNGVTLYQKPHPEPRRETAPS
ncbi:diguanylate cyclase [Marinobacter sp. SS21]|uniref:diguanylate cyclase n=1 Tax=Marinobacter sp. SS21 TaxID=2979460 RepID=UPI002330297D|nr:diguanylate cyclase [Marinobacter sp. SS21]MDC0662984.1 diguanylate cyclase [Marinobacter sp. SS21]